jgi:hypothetical protein
MLDAVWSLADAHAIFCELDDARATKLRLAIRTILATATAANRNDLTDCRNTIAFVAALAEDALADDGELVGS